MSDRIIKEKIKAYVREHAEPKLSDLLLIDSPSFEMVSYLANKLSNVPLECKLDTLAKTAEFKTSTGNVLLKVASNSDNQLILIGDLSEKFTPLLTAIRIHEVESYDWVYLLPEMRQSLLDEYARKVNTDKEQLRNLTSIWTS